MNEFLRHTRAAYKAELAAARKLAAAEGIGADEALRRTLAARAGSAGLAALLLQREAAHALALERQGARNARHAQARLRQQTRHQGAATAWRGWFDGSAHPNPGRCGIGALLIGPAGERVEVSQAAGYGNSSEAEYRALIALLEAALRSQARGLTVYGDSRGVIDDVNGDEGTAAPSLAPYRAKVRRLLERIGDVVLRWLPRHKNQEADALSQRAVAAMGAPDQLS